MKESIQDRVYRVLIESNAKLAAAGVPGQSDWTEANARKLAVAIVKEGRRQQCSNSIILMRVHEFSEKKVTALCRKTSVSMSIRTQTTRPPSENLLRRMINYLHS